MLVVPGCPHAGISRIMAWLKRAPVTALHTVVDFASQAPSGTEGTQTAATTAAHWHGVARRDQGVRRCTQA